MPTRWRHSMQQVSSYNGRSDCRVIARSTSQSVVLLSICNAPKQAKQMAHHRHIVLMETFVQWTLAKYWTFQAKRGIPPDARSPCLELDCHTATHIFPKTALLSYHFAVPGMADTCCTCLILVRMPSLDTVGTLLFQTQ